MCHYWTPNVFCKWYAWTGFKDVLKFSIAETTFWTLIAFSTMSWQPSIALGSILSPQWPSMIWHWKFIWYFPHWLSSDWIKCSVIIISVQKYFASEKEILMERKENTALWSIKVNINKQSESNLAKYSNFQIFSHCSKFAVSNFENDLECHFLLQIYICFFAEGRCVLKTNHHVLDAREPD